MHGPKSEVRKLSTLALWNHHPCLHLEVQEWSAGGPPGHILGRAKGFPAMFMSQHPRLDLGSTRALSLYGIISANLTDTPLAF